MKGSRFLPLILLLGSWLTQGSAQTVETVDGPITENTIWTADKTWLLSGSVFVKNGSTLTIEPGTVIKGEKFSKGTLIITRGSKIIADGTPTHPVVFTSNEATPAPGDWGGVVILGYAPTNKSANGIPCLGVVEGGLNNLLGDAFYGGGDQAGGCGIVNDNSGILRYVRIEYAGRKFQLDNELNGLTLAGVGHGTVVDYVQVSHSDDDGFEWFGGTVNCKHLISYANRDDDLDCDNGYQGNVQHALVIRRYNRADVSGSNALEIDNDQAGTPVTPKTSPTFSNLTVIGPSGQIDENYRRAAHLRRNSEPGIFNSLFMGDFPVGLYIEGVASVSNAQLGMLDIKNTGLSGADELLKTSDQSFNIHSWFATPGWNNATSTAANPYALQAPYNTAMPNAQPTYTSSALWGASFSDSRLTNAFFDHTNHLGAFDGANDWTCGWAKFEQINDDCFVETDSPDLIVEDFRVSPTLTQGEGVAHITLAQSAPFSVEAYRIDGQFIQHIASADSAPAGEYDLSFNLAGLPEGIYVVRLQAGGAVKLTKLMLTR